MEFSVRHHIPGRIRLSVPALRDPSPLAESTLCWVNKQDWVTEARINYACANLIIEYERRQRSKLDEMLALLSDMDTVDIDALLKFLDPTGGAGAIGAARGNYKPPDQSSPLALPTVSLALAFSANPVAVAVNVPLMLYCALPIFKRTWLVWSREERLNVDFLDTLAITASMGQGNMVAGGVITWLIRLGDWIRDLTAAGSKRAVSELLEFQTKMAWVVVDGEVVSISAAKLALGDTVVVYPGEMIPVDGEIIHGHGMIDQKTITGEGLPAPRALGETVFAATILREGQLTLRSLRVGAETTAGQIARLVDSAPIGDTRMQNHAERFADRLVLPTLALAVGAATLTRDFDRFLSLVIVDYGTGIRIAAPTAVLSSMMHAARVGIIIKSGGHMEKLAKVDTVVFDKTGTLSHGTPHIVDIIAFNAAIPADKLLGLAVASETHLQHPVAEALREKARQLRIEPPPCDETEYKIGLGVEGQVDGYYMQVGSERFMRHSGIQVEHIADERAAIDKSGHSCLYIAIDGELAGLIAYEDQIRPESREIIETLHRMGVRDTIMLTGDNAVVAEAVGKRLGLTRQVANMMPADKADVIKSLQLEGRVVAMIGDGINDSPALSFADVGIAMKHGADITHESADVVLMEDSLWKLIKAIEISRDAVGLIKQNYGIVAALNTVALGLALPGNLISPEITAVISNGSAIMASLNGIRPALRHE
jgi:Cu2+-exporting ATPase